MTPENSNLDNVPQNLDLDSSLETEAAPQAPVQAPAPVEPPSQGFRRFFSLKHRKALFIVNGVVLGLIIIIGAVSFFVSNGKVTGGTNAPKATNYATTSLPVKNVQANQELQIGQANQLSINGQVTVGNTLVLAPTATPTNPSTGQIYYNQTTNTPYYYNGKQFVAFGSTANSPVIQQYVASIGGSSGSINIGTGLQVASGQLAVQLQAGNGISVDGSTITNSGVVGLTAGTSNLTITPTGNGSYTLSDSSLTGSGTAGQVALFSGDQSLGNSILSQSGTSLTAAGSLAIQDAASANSLSITTAISSATLTVSGLASAGSLNIANGDLTIDGSGNLITGGTVSTNTVQQTATGTLNLGGMAAGDTLSLNSGGRSFIFPTTGSNSQTICTTGITCASGGGQAVLLQPGSAMTDSGTGSSIWINGTGGGDLLQLEGNGNNSFVVTNAGDVTVAGTLAVQNSGGLTVGIPGSVTGSLNLASSTSSNETVLQAAAPSSSGNATIKLPSIAGGTSDTICLATLDNCTAVGAAGGDLTGNYPNPTIAKLQGNPLTITSPATGQVLQYNGSAFVNGLLTNANLSSGTYSNITGTGALAGGSIATGFGTISTANNITTTAALQGNSLSINSGAFAVNNSGAITAATGITSSGTITFSGLTAGGVVQATAGTGALGIGLVQLGVQTTGQYVSGLIANGTSHGGAITISNATYTNSSTIAINDAAADGATLGIAAFNSTNFTASSGIVNTIQNINNTATPTFNGATLQGNTTALTLSGTPTASATSSLVQIGSAISGGNTLTNGGTYIGINEPSSGAGTEADFVNFELNGTSEFDVGRAGNITDNGTYNSDTLTSSQLLFGAASAATLDSASGQTLDIGTSANAHNVVIGNTTGTSSVSLQGGTGGISIGNSAIANTIQIGNTTGAVSQTIDIGNNTTASSVNTLVLGSTIGTSPTTVQSGSSGISLAGNTTISGADTFATGTGAVSLKGATTVSSGKAFIADGSGLFKDSTNSTTAFQIQNSSASVLLGADTTDGVLGIGAAPSAGGATLQVTGTVSSTGTITVGSAGNTFLSSTALVIGGVTMCSVSSPCSGSPASGNYIQNGITLQTGNFNIQSTSAGDVGGVIEGALSQTSDLLDLQTDNSGTATNVVSIGATGNTTIATNSNTAFQIQNTSGTAALSVNTNTLTTTLQAGTSTATLGSNVITDQNMSDGNWTSTGWNTSICTGAPDCAENNSANTSPLSTSQFTPTSGDVYQVSYTVSGIPSSGSTLSVTLGGATVASYTFNGTPSGNFTDTRLVTAANSTGLLTFTPSSTFTGTISSVSVQLLTQNLDPVLVVNNSSGTANIQITASNNVNSTFVGLDAGQSNVTGTHNTAFGAFALQDNTTGGSDVAIGAFALQDNTTGGSDVAIGNAALQNNTVGDNTVAIGNAALQDQTTGTSNTAIGNSALADLTIATGDVAIGGSVLDSITTGSDDTSIGQGSSNSITTANSNTVIGQSAFIADTGGSADTAIGQAALVTNTTGTNDTALGKGADVLSTGLIYATVIGSNAQAGSSNSIILGYSSANSIDDTVGIGTSFAPNALTVSPNTYGTNGTAGTGTTITQSGTTITGSGTTFTSAMTGGTIYYSTIANGTTATVTYVNATTLTSSVSKTVAAGSSYNIVYGGFNVTSTGTAYLQPTTNSTSAFEIQNAAATTTLLDVDTTDGVIGIGAAPTAGGSTLQVTGSISATTAVNVGSNTYLSPTALVIGGNPVCTSSGCGSSSGPGSYIANSINQQTGNFNIQSTSAGSTGAVIEGASGQTADLLDLENGSGTKVMTVGNTGNVLVAPSTNSTTAFQIQNSSASVLLGADTTDGVLGIGAAPSAGGATLQVTGTVSSTGTITVGSAGNTFLSSTALVIGGVTMCSVSSPCSGSPASGNYIQNGITLQTGNFNIQSTSAGDVGGVIEGALSQTSDLLDLQTDNSGTATNVVSIGATGNTTIATNSNTAFQIQNTSGTAALSVNTNTLTTTLQAGTANDTTTLGANLATCTDFTNITNPCAGNQWTTTGWSATTTTVTHNTGNTSALSTNQVTPVNGETYEISYTISGTPSVSGTLNVTFGGKTVASYTFSTNNGTYTEARIVTASSNSGNLTFTPNSTFNGIISAVTIQQVTQEPVSVLVINNASGTVNIQVTASSSTTNTFVGLSSGSVNSTGTQDTAFGSQALQGNTTGSSNAAFGYDALQLDSSGKDNTAVGNQALADNTDGNNDTAVGQAALQSSTNGFQNTAVGANALQALTTGSNNTAVGDAALISDITGGANTAIGYQALQSNTSASSNVAIGYQALASATSGGSNVAIGRDAGYTSSSANATTTGTQDTFLGYQSGQGLGAYQVSNSTALGVDSIVNQSNAIILGCTNNQNGCTSPTTVGIGSQYAPNALTVSPNTYGTWGTAGQSTSITQSGTTITGSGTTFTAGMTGGTIYYADGTTATVTYISATSLTSSVSKTISSAANYTIVYGGFNVTSGGTAYLQPVTDSTSAFSVQNASSDSTVFDVDTVNNRVGIGTSTPGAKLDIQAASNIGLNVNQTGSNNLLQLQSSGTNVVTVTNSGATTFENSANSTSAFVIQNQSGAALLTADTTHMILTVQALVVSVSLTVDGHVITGNSSGTTTATVNANAGSGGSPSCTISGNDTGGQITLTTGTGGWAAGTQCTINFANSYGSAPHPVISNATNVNTAVVVPYVNSTTGNFTIIFVNADTAQHTYVWNYFNAQ